ncbi:MAG: MarR family winged helix-turn-helix transcriptional regulator [Planctomycetota bacterium]
MKPDDRQDLHHRIADAIERLATLARAGEQQAASDQSLSPLQGRILAQLARRGALRVGDIGKHLMLTQGTVSAAISTLASKALVQKRRDPSEQRAVLVELTRPGQRAATAPEHGRTEPIAAAVAMLSGVESGLLLASLLKLIGTLEQEGRIAATRMCLGCRHFVPGGGRGQKPHFCRLLDRAIGNAELRVDCPEHAPADAMQRGAALAAFHASR